MNEEYENWKEHFYYYVSLGEGYKHSKKEMLDQIESIIKKSYEKGREDYGDEHQNDY